MSVSAETDFSDTIMEIFSPAKDFDLHSHKVDRQVATIDFRKADRVLLGGDDCLSQFLFAAIDHLDDFELSEAVVIGEFAGVNQFSAKMDQALFETFRLGNPAQ